MRTLALLAIGSVLCSPAIYAQPGETGAATSAPAAGRVRAASELGSADPSFLAKAFPFPKIDASDELRQKDLIRELRNGGFVLYLRHTQTGTITAECTQSNLTFAGERDARFLGESIRGLRIPIDRVVSSPICRVFDTAKLLGLGRVETTFELGNMPSVGVPNLERARLKRLQEVPLAGSNRMLVSHLQRGNTEQDRLDLDFGEIIVFNPRVSPPKAVARIRADDWYELSAAPDKARTKAGAPKQ